MMKFKHAPSDDGNWLIIDTETGSSSSALFGSEVEARMKAIALSLEFLNSYLAKNGHSIFKRHV